jgi:exosortase family protein XrtF
MTFLKHPVAAFLLKAFGLYAVYFIVYELWLHPQGNLDLLVIDNLIASSSAILRTLGFSLIEYPYVKNIRTIGVDGTHGLWVGDPCNGLSLFALFTGFILAFPGSWKSKGWFIPAGVLSIHLINILRVTGLAILQVYFPDSVEFNHTYTFTLLVYSWIFILWIIWVNKFAVPVRKVTT